MFDSDDEKQIFKVVMNDEEQYSIWPVELVNALGWVDAGKQGTKRECLSFIEEVWTDMRPLSLRKFMAEHVHAKNASVPADAEASMDT